MGALGATSLGETSDRSLIQSQFLHRFEVELREAAPASPGNVVGRMVSWLCRKQLARMSELATDFERSLDVRGLVGASEDLFASLGARIEVEGRDSVPQKGPLLIVSNHPGLLDTLALAVALQRDDLKVVARRHPLWDAAPNLRERLVLLPESSHAPASAIRCMIERLKDGGALLIFPSGKIDPDPAVFSVEASDSASWSHLPWVLARRAEGTPIVPVVVYDVFSKQAYRHPLVWLHRNAERRRWLAATLQFLGGARPPPVTHVLIGESCRVDGEARATSVDSRAREVFQELLGRVPVGCDRKALGWGVANVKRSIRFRSL